MSDDDVLAKLRAEHGELCVVKSRAGQLAFKTPSHAEYERFQDKVSKLGTKGGSTVGIASRDLCLACAVHPSRDDMRAALERQPALALKIADVLADMAGADAEIEIQKA